MSNDEIFGIINYINSLTFSEFEMETGDIKIRIQRQGASGTKVSADSFSTETNVKKSMRTAEPSVRAPISGVFYQASAPGENPFVTVGDSVQKGDTLCILEAMKMMNEVKSDRNGIIKEVLVKDGDSVNESDVLFIFQGA